FKTEAGKRVMVINLMGRLFMDALDDPFAVIADRVGKCKLGSDADAILVDFHGEATSEKMAMGHFLDGKVSIVVGTHTHVPTADAHVLSGGTAYMTDAGMCGDYDSVIGMKKEGIIARFVTKLPGERMQVAEGEGTLCAIFIETDDDTGRAKAISPVRIGGKLASVVPTP
ncbi:MAG: TIGR00282 family metallophosphoesterase, partial [Stellaceae bacterium]